ncbi:WxL protein peptidoglycan domain-containing protein, partial [Enterococcus sp. OL5]|uniref:WxL protein peptidoglycan domain-containing protein n=1 Tax=Enterococcus sp. OL5 TaxID=2590214 RepID=UPI0011292B97
MKQLTLVHLRIKATWWLLPLFSLLLVLFPSAAQAEETLSFYVTPEFPESQIEGSTNYFDLNLGVGETEILALKLQNASSEPIQVQVTPHTAYTNVHGVVEYG